MSPQRLAAFRWLILLAGVGLLLDGCAVFPVGSSASGRDDALLLTMAMYGNLMESQQDWDQAGGVSVSGKTGLAALWSSPSDLNAVLLLIAQTAAWCNQTGAVIAATMPEGPREVAAAELDRTCAQELAKLESRTKALEKGGGKRQSWWRRTWVGRGLSWAGRKVIKPAAPEVLMVLMTGGGGLAAKRLFLRQGRRALDKELRGWGGRLLARKGVKREFIELVGLTPGPERLTRAATAAEAPAEAPVAEGTEGLPTTLSVEEWAELIGAATAPAATEDTFQLPASGAWTAVCKSFYAEPEWIYEWTLVLDLANRTFNSAYSAQSDTPMYAGHWNRHEEFEEQGSGTIAEDGVLEGTYTDNEIWSMTYLATGESVVGDPQVGKGQMYGTFSTDLKRVCISRGLQPGAFDPTYLRRLGRDLFFAPEKGCEAECTIVRGP